MARLRIDHADWVLTLDLERRIYRDGGIAIVDDRLAGVGPAPEVARAFPEADEVIDGRDRLVLPGLIDAHVHNILYLGKNTSVEMFLRQELFRRIYPIETHLTSDDAVASTYGTHLEAIKNGVTTIVEAGSYFPDELVAVLRETGLRGVVSRTAADVYETGLGAFPEQYIGREPRDRAVAEAERVIREYHGALGGRVRAWPSLRFLQACSDDLCAALQRVATRHGTRLQIHAAHSREGIEATMARYGLRDVERLHRLGLLGPHLVTVHMVWVSAPEMVLLRDHRVNVVHCPSSNIKTSYGAFSIGRFPEMLDMGIPVCLGSDGGMGTSFSDLVRTMYLFASVYKDTRHDPALIAAETALEMATIRAAEVLGWADEIGSLEVGKKADLTLVDITAPEWTPLVNPVATLVYSATGAHVDTVIVDGRLLMRGRRVLVLDEDRVRQRVQEAAEGLLTRAGIRGDIGPRWPVVAPSGATC